MPASRLIRATAAACLTFPKTMPFTTAFSPNFPSCLMKGMCWALTTPRLFPPVFMPSAVWRKSKSRSTTRLTASAGCLLSKTPNGCTKATPSPFIPKTSVRKSLNSAPKLSAKTVKKALKLPSTVILKTSAACLKFTAPCPCRPTSNAANRTPPTKRQGKLPDHLCQIRRRSCRANCRPALYRPCV